MPHLDRTTILRKFHNMIEQRVPIVGGGAETELSTKCEKTKNIDLIIIYNSEHYRITGHNSTTGLLTYNNTNEIVKNITRKMLPIMRTTPMLTDINRTDPFVLIPQFLAELKAMGFSNVQNFPTIELFDDIMRASFKKTGMDYELKINMIQKTHTLDLLTTPYIFNADKTQAMTTTNADMIITHIKITIKNNINTATAKTLNVYIGLIDDIAQAARTMRSDMIVLCHDEPIATPEDAQYILQHTHNCHGFFNTSNMEHLPTEIALTEQTRRFKNVQF